MTAPAVCAIDYMAQLRLKTRLAFELPKINAALDRAHALLPEPVAPIARHIFAAGGKRLRPFLAILTARLFGFTGDQIYDLAVSLEMLHAATLLHDDVIDEAPLRRGKPAAHMVYSVTATILAGDALLALGNALVAGFANPKLSECYSLATVETCAGEVREIAGQRNPTLSRDEYLAIIRGKTARLIRAACTMGAILAGASESDTSKAADFGENLGIAFQLVDDAIDFSDEAITGKPSGGDLLEGKLTLPVRFYRDQLSVDEQQAFDQAFRAASQTKEECAKIAETIRAKGYDQQTRAFADTYLNDALKALEPLPKRAEKDLLHDMTAYVRERTK